MKTLIAVCAATILIGTLPFPSVFVPAALAQECLDYGDYLGLAGEVGTPDLAYGLAIAGSYASVADRESGLQVLAGQDPQFLVDQVQDLFSLGALFFVLSLLTPWDSFGTLFGNGLICSFDPG